MFKPDTTRVWVLTGAALLAACSSDHSPVSADDAGAADRARNQGVSEPAASIPGWGGIWRGTDSAGHEYLLLAAPFGARIADLTLGYASTRFGALNGSADPASPASGYAFWAYSPLADIGSYGWSLCVLFAEWQSGLPIDGALDCGQMPDGDWTRDVHFEFDGLSYGIDADLSLLAGTWTDTSDPGADVLSIDGSGQLTGQSAATDCFYGGQASVFDSSANIYSIRWSFDNCSGDNAGLNGVVFTGLATIDFDVVDWFTATPKTLRFLGTGRTFIPPYEENGLGISLTAIYDKY